MSFVYIVATVTVGYPLITGIAYAAGVTGDRVFYITRFCDSLIYFWLPQINIIIVSLCNNLVVRLSLFLRMFSQMPTL